MKFNKQELRKAAEKSTEGNYVVGHCDINKHGNLSSVYVCQEWNGMAGGVVAECHVNCLTKNSDQVYANAGFMALASPANVISLLEEISTLESRCAELAAENAGLKSAFDKPDAWLSWHSIPPTFYEPDRGGEYLQVHEKAGEKNDDGSDSWPVYRKPETETPATAAFLAEVRASGVDIAIAELNQLAQRSEKEAPIAAEHHRSAALYLQLFAAQLRKGVQS